MHSDVIYLLFLAGSFVFQGQAYSDQIAVAFRSRRYILQFQCPNSKIRLGDLYFSNFLNDSTEGKTYFTEEETSTLYSGCSYKDKCFYKVPDWHGYFQVSVQYWCVEPDTVVPLTANIAESTDEDLNLIYDMTDTNTAPYMSDISCDVISNTSGLEVWMEDFRGCPITKLYYKDTEEPLACNHSLGVFMEWLPVQVKYSETSGQLLYNFAIHVNSDQPKGMFWLRLEALDLTRITLECSPIIPPTMTSHQPTLTSQISQETPSTSWTTSSSADQLTKKKNKDNTVAVVGAVVGADVLLVATVSVVCFLYQRSKRRQSTSADCKVAQHLAYDVTRVPERDADQTSEPDQTDPAKHTTESQHDSIYHEPGTSSDLAAVSSDINEEDYNKIDLHSKKAFSVDLNYDILAPHARFVTDPNYSHISDVTTAQHDTYSHIPAQPGTTTQGKKDESYSDDTYNHLTNTARLEVRDNNKDFSDEYSNIGNLSMTRNAGQQTPHKIALDKQHGEKLSDLKQNLGEFVPALSNQNGRQMKASVDGMTNMSRSQVTDVNTGREINDVRNHRKTSEDSDHTYFVLEKQ